MTISIKDLVGKMIGVMVAMMHIMDGSLKTINSSWNGPPGQMVRAIGKCFHPETKIKLNYFPNTETIPRPILPKLNIKVFVTNLNKTQL
jgi:hypothetical protein